MGDAGHSVLQFIEWANDGFGIKDARERVLATGLRGKLRGHDPYAQAREIHSRHAATAVPLQALLAVDASTFMLDDVLVKVGRTSMMHSLEVRCPLLDHHVLEYVASLPFSSKLRGNTTKWIRREVVRDLLPPSILARGTQGFGVPLERWFGEDFGRLAREVLFGPRARARGWLGPREAPGARASTRVGQVWTHVCLELWAQSYVDRPREAAAAPDAPAWSVRSTAAA